MTGWEAATPDRQPDEALTRTEFTREEPRRHHVLDMDELERRIKRGDADLLPGWAIFPSDGKAPAWDGVGRLAFSRAASVDPVERQRLASLDHDGWAVWTRDLAVLDLDIGPSANGPENWARLVSGPLPSVMVTTPSGGSHAYYRATPGLRSGESRIPGVTVKTGNQTSTFAGAGRRLAWIDWEFPPITGALLSALLPKPATPVRRRRRPWAGETAPHWFDQVQRAAEGVKATPEGGRNDALNRAAFGPGRRAVEAGVTEATVSGFLVDAGLSAGLSATEAAATVRSGLRGRR